MEWIVTCNQSRAIVAPPTGKYCPPVCLHALLNSPTSGDQQKLSWKKYSLNEKHFYAFHSRKKKYSNFPNVFETCPVYSKVLHTISWAKNEDFRRLFLAAGCTSWEPVQVCWVDIFA